jgi:cell division protein FtsB
LNSNLSKAIMLSLIGGFLILGGFLLLGDNGVLKYLKLNSELQEVKAENKRLSVENAKLRKEAKALLNDISHIERRAREKLGLLRENEMLVRFATTPDSSTAPVMQERMEPER